MTVDPSLPVHPVVISELPDLYPLGRHHQHNIGNTGDGVTYAFSLSGDDLIATDSNGVVQTVAFPTSNATTSVSGTVPIGALAQTVTLTIPTGFVRGNLSYVGVQRISGNEEVDAGGKFEEVGGNLVFDLIGSPVSGTTHILVYNFIK